jgi:hypothetical protein
MDSDGCHLKTDVAGLLHQRGVGVSVVDFIARWCELDLTCILSADTFVRSVNEDGRTARELLTTPGIDVGRN